MKPKLPPRKADKLAGLVLDIAKLMGAGVIASQFTREKSSWYMVAFGVIIIVVLSFIAYMLTPEKEDWK